MARVTIEDCLAAVGGHFNVSKIASRRAQQLELGAEPLVERGNDKNAVIALREIAAGLIDEEVLNAIPAEELMEVEIAAVSQDEATLERAEEEQKKAIRMAKAEAAKAEAEKEDQEEGESGQPKEEGKPLNFADQVTEEDVGMVVDDVAAHNDSDINEHDEPDAQDIVQEPAQSTSLSAERGQDAAAAGEAPAQQENPFSNAAEASEASMQEEENPFVDSSDMADTEASDDEDKVV